MTKLKTRIEQKKKELKEKNIDVNSITPREIEELLDSNVVTINDAENLFPEEKLMKLRMSKIFSKIFKAENESYQTGPEFSTAEGPYFRTAGSHPDRTDQHLQLEMPPLSCDRGSRRPQAWVHVL